MREWRCGFEVGGAGQEASMGESATMNGGQGHRYDGSVIEHLCIRVYWNLGNKSHEQLFTDSH